MIVLKMPSTKEFCAAVMFCGVPYLFTERIIVDIDPSLSPARARPVCWKRELVTNRWIK
jgi:hypothetical protein